mgnify:CR=1 FL=1|jgi:hypothetical protein|tara:strand:- start:481 stop:732 length:252 start_codon:yes stop_codon:yes gene_type:complete
MSEKQATIQQLAQLAMEGDNVNPIEWGELAVNEEQAFLLMASQVLDQMEGCPEDQRAVVSMATMTKLLVENFVLNLRLEGKVE